MRFLKYLYELFDTKNYHWIKQNEIQNIATFHIVEDYFIHIDLIGANVYNLYFFYYGEDGQAVFNLLNRDDKSVFKIFSNVKNCVEEFMSQKEVDFLGFSAEEKDRKPIYMLFLQNLCSPDYSYSFTKKRKTYYFLYKKDQGMLSTLHMRRFMENDDKIKK